MYHRKAKVEKRSNESCMNAMVLTKENDYLSKKKNTSRHSDSDLCLCSKICGNLKDYTIPVYFRFAFKPEEIEFEDKQRLFHSRPVPLNMVQSCEHERRPTITHVIVFSLLRLV